MPTGTAAWEEAQASVRPDLLTYFTLELQHPGFVDEEDEPIPIRVVTGVDDDMEFGIEDGAVFDAGGMASFQACMFTADHPEFAEGKIPEVTVVIDNVSRLIQPYLQKAMKIRADLVVLYREYLSDDLSEPAYGPVEFVGRRAKVTGTRVEFTAALDNLANKRFPRKIYTIADFPGLQP